MANETKKQGDAYAYTSLSSYRPANPEELAEHTERVREEVVPEIQEQQQKKETGAQRARAYKLF